MRTSDLVGHDDVVGARHAQLADRIVHRRPADDVDVGCHFSGSEHNVQVLGIVWEGCDDRFGPCDARIGQILVTRGVAWNDHQAFLSQPFRLVGISFDNDHWSVVVDEFLNGHFTDPTQSTHDDVVGQFFNFLFQACLFECVSVFSIDKVRREGGNGIGKRAQTAHDQNRGEHHAFLTQLPHLSKSHGRHRDHRHVKRLHPRVSLHKYVSDAAKNDHANHKRDGEINSGEHAEREHHHCLESTT